MRQTELGGAGGSGETTCPGVPGTDLQRKSGQIPGVWVTGAKTVIWKDWVLVHLSAAGWSEVTSYSYFMKNWEKRA